MITLQEKLKNLREGLTKELTSLNGAESLDIKISACENILNSEPKNIRAKLEWIWFQAEASNVPVSALVSPLQEATSLPVPDPDSQLAVATISKIAELLVVKKQNRLALAIIETADRISSNRENFSDSQTLTFKEVLLELYQAESAGAVKRRESKSYFESLEKKIAGIQNDLKKLQKKSKSEPEKKSAPEKKIGNSRMELPKQDSELKSDPAVDPIMEDLKVAFAKNRPSPSHKGIYVAIIVLLLGIVIYLSPIFSSSDFAFNEVAALSAPDVFPEISKPLIPQPQLRDELVIAKAMVDDKLSKIDDRIKNLNFDKEKDSDVDQEALEKAETKIEKEVKPVENTQTELPPKKEKVEEKVIPGKTPMLDPERLAKQKLEQLGSTIPGNDLRMGPDGRVYGPMVDKGDLPIGAPSFPVEQFDPPLVFKTIVDTKVLSAPSMVSSEVAFLRSGSTIQVVVKMDRWLEIRSSGGRKGYIFAQDAVPVN